MNTILTPQLTLEVRHAVFNAYAEAKRLDDDHINTEHLLLGLLCCEDNQATKFLQEQGIHIDELREAVEMRLASRYVRTKLNIPMTPRAEKVLALTGEEATRQCHAKITTEHLLLALLIEGEGLAAIILREFGLDRDNLRKIVSAEQKSRSSDSLSIVMG